MGYVLKGWSTDPEATTPNVDEKTVFADAEVNLYAVMKRAWIAHTVKFAWNYEDAEEEFFEVAYTDRTGHINAWGDARRDGYWLGGWYRNPGCTGDPVNLRYTVFEEDTILYAKWI